MPLHKPVPDLSQDMGKALIELSAMTFSRDTLVARFCALGLLASLVTAFFGSVAPALKATKLDVAQALRN
ncbi:hypothetical protein [Glutamicibacter sp. NPDC087344]|uniref:hypothetical protein n=1 Tax=Glutamicibacter sp. NPDC087344 TaxID=3363994 RepID=UPI003826DA93